MNTISDLSLSSSLKILEGLGRPTLRGIKKCRKCGVYNGTRRTFCKNKQCELSLISNRNHMNITDAVKLLTGTVKQVYSVCVKDSAGLECRGFVQLPSNYDENSNNIQLSDVALCFVDTCQRSFNNSILKCHEENISDTIDNIDRTIKTTCYCEHIELALKSRNVARPLRFDKFILNRLNVPEEIKQTLCLLESDNNFPLVQRVSKNVLAVRCLVTSKHPLGYLHFTIVNGKNKNDQKYYCNCGNEYLITTTSNSLKKKCIHYYACGAAMLSEPAAYLGEYSSFINNEDFLKSKTVNLIQTKIIKEMNPVSDGKRDKINKIPCQSVRNKNRLIKKDTKKAIIIQNQKYLIEKCQKIVPKIYPIEIKVLSKDVCPKTTTTNNISDPTWSFLDWLSFVTESINKTMQFMNCGIINTQFFYIPKEFYKAIKSRIPAIYTEQKSDIGSTFFSIMNVNHVKEIFDTPKVKLRIAKKFIHNLQKGYVEYDENNTEEGAFTHACLTYGSSFIFFLNVGQSTVDESDNQNNAFIIEWLPDIFNSVDIGQLKFQYKYGRKCV